MAPEVIACDEDPRKTYDFKVTFMLLCCLNLNLVKSFKLSHFLTTVCCLFVLLYLYAEQDVLHQQTQFVLMREHDRLVINCLLKVKQTFCSNEITTLMVVSHNGLLKLI